MSHTLIWLNGDHATEAVLGRLGRLDGIATCVLVHLTTCKQMMKVSIIGLTDVISIQILSRCLATDLHEGVPSP